MKKIFITKYALTSGIRESEATITSYSKADKSVEYARETGAWTALTMGTDAFYSLKDAKVEAEKMRKKKITSLKKQLSKLEKLSFKGK